MKQTVPILRKEQLNSLIKITPLIMDWLRSSTTFAADLLQQSYEEDYRDTAFALSQLVSALNDNVDASFGKLSSIFEKFRVSVWANALRLILTNSNPKIVPTNIGSDIVGTIPQLNGATTINEVCHILGPLLDKLPRSHFVAIGEFCALLRDTGTNSTFLACLVGPQLLLPQLLITSPGNQGPAALAAAAVFDLLISEGENLFGRAASARATNPFGEFVTQKRKKQDARIDFSDAANDRTLTVAKNALRAFYDWRDPVKSGNTDRLFVRLSIYEIAEGIQKQYGVIPPGWGILLSELAKKQSISQASMPTSPSPSLPSSRQINQNTSSLLPTEVNYSNLKRVKKQQPKKMEHVEGEKLQRVILELCHSEAKYYNILNTFISTYCERLKDITLGRERENEVGALGLSAQDFESVFGQKFVSCKDVAELFNSKLTILTDFKGQGSMLSLVLDAVREIFPKLNVLGPYMATYLYSVKTIKEKADIIRKKSKRKKKKKAPQGLNFLQLWELERVKHDNLKLSSIENVLIKPVQRIPQYKTLFKELLKLAKKENHPLIAQCEQLVESTEALGQSIDRQVNLSSKATKKFM